jgi:hypothetical protein
MTMITVVSGLPRSGTSLVMQMLAAGGYPILSDHVRTPDEDNPRGYLEYEKVKTLERDQSWLAEAEGKAVKIVSFLLPKLPENFDYRVIFVRRDLDEVIRSQEKMLERRGQPPGPSADVMKTHFERHLHSVEAWLAGQAHLSILWCRHADILSDAETESRRIADFLQTALDLPEMTGVVDPALYRQRVGH